MVLDAGRLRIRMNHGLRRFPPPRSGAEGLLPYDLSRM